MQYSKIFKKTIKKKKKLNSIVNCADRSNNTSKTLGKQICSLIKLINHKFNLLICAQKKKKIHKTHKMKFVI